MLREARLVPEKAEPPIEVTEVGLAKVTEDMAMQSWKAWLPIVVTEDGIVIVASELQLEKAWLPIEETEAGLAKVTEDMAVQL